MATYGTSFNTKDFNKSGSDIHVEYAGDWIKLPRLFRYLTGKQGRGIKRDIAKAHRDFANKLKLVILMGINTGGAFIGANWPPHSPNYQGNELLRLNYNYATALQNMKAVQKNYITTLRLNSGDAKSKSVYGGLSMGQYAVIHEVGSRARSIPARPLWGPSYRKLGGSKAILKMTKGAVQRRLSKMGINVGHTTFQSSSIRIYGT